MLRASPYVKVVTRLLHLTNRLFSRVVLFDMYNNASSHGLFQAASPFSSMLKQSFSSYFRDVSDVAAVEGGIPHVSHFYLFAIV